MRAHTELVIFEYQSVGYSPGYGVGVGSYGIRWGGVAMKRGKDEMSMSFSVHEDEDEEEESGEEAEEEEMRRWEETVVEREVGWMPQPISPILGQFF